MGFLELILGGIARHGSITARAAVKDRRPPQAAGAFAALVLDGEHGVIGLIGQANPPSYSLLIAVQVPHSARVSVNGEQPGNAWSALMSRFGAKSGQLQLCVRQPAGGL